MSVTITAPAQQPEIDDPVEDDRYRALIEEAKHRARRRRAMYAGAALLLVVAAVTVTAARGGDPPSHEASVVEPDPPLELPANMDPNDGAKVVAEHAAFGVGWVFVYGDGRVVWQLNGSRGIGERHLSQLGWEGLRSGDVQLSEFLRGYADSSRQDRWFVDPAGIAYEPSRYALCSNVVSPEPGAPVLDAPTDVVNAYPAALQPLLRGREHVYAGTEVLSGASHPSECFEVTSAVAMTAIRYLTDPAGEVQASRPSETDPWSFVFTSVRGMDIWAQFFPLLPHGEWALMGA